jgi:hypothetical protein
MLRLAMWARSATSGLQFRWKVAIDCCGAQGASARILRARLGILPLVQGLSSREPRRRRCRTCTWATDCDRGPGSPAKGDLRVRAAENSDGPVRCPLREEPCWTADRDLSGAMCQLRLALLNRQGHPYHVSGHDGRKGMPDYVAHGT